MGTKNCLKGFRESASLNPKIKISKNPQDLIDELKDYKWTSIKESSSDGECVIFRDETYRFINMTFEDFKKSLGYNYPTKTPDEVKRLMKIKKLIDEEIKSHLHEK